MIKMNYKSTEEYDKWNQVESTKIQIKKLPAIETKVLDNSLT
jgi:hypothetical protein